MKSPITKPIVLSAEAEQNIDDILTNVAEFTGSVLSANKLMNEFLERFEFIRYFPDACKKYDEFSRQTFCRSYRIIYEEQDNCILIITVIHSRRKYPQ